MSNLEVGLVFAGIPAAIIAVITLLTFLPELMRRPRYRPGQAWDHEPVWWIPDPGELGEQSPGGRPASDGERGGARGSW